MQLIVREVAKNVGTGSLKDTYDPREGPSRSEDNDGEFTGPLLDAVPLVLLLVLTACSGMSSRISAGLEWVPSLADSSSWSLMTTSECEGEQTGKTMQEDSSHRRVPLRSELTCIFMLE